MPTIGGATKIIGNSRPITDYWNPSPIDTKDFWNPSGGGLSEYDQAKDITNQRNEDALADYTSQSNESRKRFTELSEYLKSILAGGLPGKDQLRQQAHGQIGRATNTAATKAKENMAASGMSNSGVASSLINDIYGSQSQAYGQVESDLANKELDWKENAVSKLLGVEQFRAGLNEQQIQQARDYFLKLHGMWNQSDQFGRQMDAEGEMDWGSVLGAALGTAGTIAASDKKVKDNIEYTGEKTKDGIPIATFNYKGGSKKFKGVIAQDVEKVKPSAVVKAVDYAKI